MNISDYLNLNLKGHTNFEFVDVFLDHDNLLFLDPCLIEKASDAFSMRAQFIISTYFDELYSALQKNKLYTDALYSHAHEPNATKLGYGNGHNGKGRTAKGLQDCLSQLRTLVHSIPTISCPQDVSILVAGFAEDGLSDLLTNILHDWLNSFTAEQMAKYGCKPDSKKAFWTWNSERREWEEVIRPCWLYKGKELLLVPKWIVRKNFLFSAHQYLYGVIIERIRRENEWLDAKKIDIWNNMERDDEHWEYDAVIKYAIEHPDSLSEYHQKLPKYYNRAHGCMSDDDLDKAVYTNRYRFSA